MKISCAFAPSLDSAANTSHAEELGFERAWFFDSPGVYPDVWMMLGLAASCTKRIGLGPAVIVPSLRHVGVTASAIGTLAELAPGRVAAAIGTGFTGRRVFGRKPLHWADVEAYVVALRALLQGESVEWEGAEIRMMHRPGFAAARPIDVPILVAADGPKGQDVARRLGDGVFRASRPKEPSRWPWQALIVYGTVLDDEADVHSERVIDAAGPSLAAGFHAAYERGADAVDAFPGGREWRSMIETVPAETRHQVLYEGHLHELMERDRPAVLEAASLLPKLTFTGTPDTLRARVERLEELGVTELVWQPAGSDIPGELRRMASALMR